ncbi:MAG: hypothetical protein ACK5B9_13975 [Flavobacteriia bacterium]|jgi:hypothetical protein
MKNSIKIILFAALGFTNQVFAQKDIDDTLHWVKLGKTIVNYENDRNEVIVTSEEKFTDLHFHVKFAPVEIEEIVVFYKNGDQQKFPMKESIKSEGFMRELELNGKERIIAKVVFQSRTIPNTKESRAIIEIWGENDED